jgi:hypothetical protein
MTRIKQKENKTKIKQIKSINTLLLLLIIFFGAYYMLGTNDLSIKSYMLQQQQKQANKIIDDNNELKLKAMSLSSLTNINDKIVALKMVKVDKVDYIAGAVTVALKR